MTWLGFVRGGRYAVPPPAFRRGRPLGDLGTDPRVGRHDPVCTSSQLEHAPPLTEVVPVDQLSAFGFSRALELDQDRRWHRPLLEPAAVSLPAQQRGVCLPL